MMKNPLSYFHIATFLLSGKSRNLSEYWKAEVIMRDAETTRLSDVVASGQ